MKRYWRRALTALLALLMLTTGALAEVDGIMPQRTADDRYLRVHNVAVVEEDVYFLCYAGEFMSLWHWRGGMEQAEEVSRSLMRGDNLNREQEFPAEDLRVKYAVSVLVSDGERLLSVNPATGLVFSLQVTADGLDCTDVATLADTDVFYRHSRSGDWYAGGRAAVSGDYLYWLGDGWDEVKQENRPRLLCFNLTDGSVAEIPATLVTAICGYRDGKLAILSGNAGENAPHSISLYDPADGTLVAYGEIHTSRSVRNLAYAEAFDALVWQEATNILGMQPGGEAQRYAYVPTRANGELAVSGENVILSLSGKTVVRPLTPGLTAPESLQVMNGYFDNAASAFAEQYPDVPVEMVSDAGTEGYASAFSPVNGGERVDVMRIYKSAGTLDFQTLRDAGMLLDLSADPEIAAWVAELYPPFRELVTGENGEIWAVPTSTTSYTGFFVNKRAMTDMGFTVEDMPANLVELCAFITMWDEKYADRYPKYCCIEYSEKTRQFLTDMAMTMWIDHCQATGRELRFDDPEFREVMEAVAAVSTVRTDVGMQVTNPEISDYKTGLFWIDCQLVGNWAAYMEDYSDRIFIPLTLTEDTPFHACVDGVELWVVNRETESAEYACAFVRQQLAQVSKKYAHVLLTTRTEPVENPYYAESLAFEQRQLGELQMQLLQVAAPEEAEAIRRMIAAQEAYIATELRRSQYEITPSAVENYVGVLVPAMHIRSYNVLQHTGDGVNARERIRDRWLEGVITTEQFIRELDTRMLMLEMAQ